MTSMGSFRKWVNNGNERSFGQEMKALPKEVAMALAGAAIGLFLVGGGLWFLGLRGLIILFVVLWALEKTLKYTTGFDPWKSKKKGRKGDDE